MKSFDPKALARRTPSWGRLGVAAAVMLATWAMLLVPWPSQSPQPHRPAQPSVRVASAPVVAPPAVTPVDYQPLSDEQARALNAALPPVLDPGPAARPFRFGARVADDSPAVECLTEAIYREAASEGVAGQRAVAQVVLNRVRHPAFPASVCGVVYQGAERPTGCQFTFTCDGSLARGRSPGGWAMARRIAMRALGGYVDRSVGEATHYHADHVVPYWAGSLVRSVTIGAHIFYRWSGGWGTPRAFSQRYAGAEPVVPGSIAVAAVPALPTPGHEGAAATVTPVVPARGARLVLQADLDAARLKPSLERQSRLLADRETSAIIVPALRYTGPAPAVPNAP